MFWVNGRSATDLCRTSSRDDEKAKPMETSGDFISMCDQDPLLLENIVMGDETLCYHFDPESKRQSMAWCSQTSPRPKKSRLQKFMDKTLLVTFFDNIGIIHKEFVPAGPTSNAVFYQAVLNRLLLRIRPELHKTGKWMPLHNNAPAHSAILVCHFLAQKMVAVVDHPPYDLICLLRTSSCFPVSRRAWMSSKIVWQPFCDRFHRRHIWLFPEDVQKLSNMYCRGFRLFSREIKKICLYL